MTEIQKSKSTPIPLTAEQQRRLEVHFAENPNAHLDTVVEHFEWAFRARISDSCVLQAITRTTLRGLGLIR